jgi:hypothetical protein
LENLDAQPDLEEAHTRIENTLAARAAVIDDALVLARTWIISHSPEPARAIVSEMPWQVLIDRPAWVHDVLEAVETTDREQLSRAFFVAALGNVYGNARLTRIAEAAQELATQLPTGSKSQELFTALVRQCQRQIDDDRRRDEEMHAGWG